MLRHKLGWQTSDQQDKAVSREVGVLLVLASVLPAGWRAGSEAAALQQGSCAARGLRGSGVGVPPAATGSPRTPSPNSTRASNHCRAPRLGPPSPKARMYTCPSFGDGPFEPGQGQRGLWRLGLGVRGACLGTPGGETAAGGQPSGREFSPRLRRTWGPVQACVRQARFLPSPQRRTRGGLGSLGHPRPRLLPPTAWSDGCWPRLALPEGHVSLQKLGHCQHHVPLVPALNQTASAAH